MGDILTAKQKAQRLFEKGGRISLGLLFPCPACGHANRPARRKIDAVKMFLLDELPPCRRCGSKLRRTNFDRSKIPVSLLKQAEAELEHRQVIECPTCAQKLRVSTDHRSIKVHCPKCEAEFQFAP